MIKLRLCNLKDVEGVYDLAFHSPIGLTTLPYDYEEIKSKVKNSVKSTKNISDFPNGDSFLFVLDDDGEIIGTSAVFTKTGGRHPHWTFKVVDFEYTSESFDKSISSQYLQLKGAINGPSEIGTLFLRRDRRGGDNGKLLSLGRFLFMRQHMDSFEANVIAELRGTIVDGNSPFWEDIGHKFMDCTLDQADKQVLVDKSFIDEMMPKTPIYVNMLSKESQNVIGQADSKTVPAKIMLERENFKLINEVDIFEAGPILRCKTKDVNTIKKSRVKVVDISTEDIDGDKCIISTHNSDDFIACIDVMRISKEKVKISKLLADTLKVSNGSKVVVSRLNIK